MELVHAGFLLLLFCSACSYQFRDRARYDPFGQDPELEWEKMETVVGEEMPQAPAPEPKFYRSGSSSGSSTPEAKKVPEYEIVPASKVQKEVFKPEKGSRSLPNSIKEMLLGAVLAAPTGRPATRQSSVEVLCHVDRMYVRIKRDVFKTKDAYKYLKLGTCPVNHGTAEYYFLLHLLKTDCGFTKENNVDNILIRNVLSYKPTGPVLREPSFAIPLQCKFPRFFHSFKVGFYPKLQGGTVFKALHPKSIFSIILKDESGSTITGAKTYILGQPMYFEVSQTKGSQSTDQRLYVNKCFMTASQDPNSNPKFTVIDNQGCMIDGKVTDQSKFLAGGSKMVQKFSVYALIFKDMVSKLSSSQQLYMHCEISLGKLAPSQSAKACNYDLKAKTWKELYGDDSVCVCCKTTCPSARPKASRSMISSHSWKVDLSSKDGYEDVDPKMKSFDSDAFSLEGPDLAEHGDFLNWQHDY